MRALVLAARTAVALPAAASLVFAPAAFATGGHGKPGSSGDNGTVKIHDARTDAEYHPRNNPKVCTFYLVGYKFDGRQKVSWWITEKSNGDKVLDGELTLNKRGHGRTGELSLPNGHYKLFWDFEGKNGAPKHKVFKVRCEEEPSAPPTEEPSGQPSQEPSGEPSGRPSQEPSGEPSAGPSGQPSDQPSTQPGSDASQPAAGASQTPQGGTGDLAETGSSAPVGWIAGGAVVLIGAGAGAIFARRRLAGRNG